MTPDIDTWNVCSGRAPSPELRAARIAAVAAFHAVAQSVSLTAQAFNLDRKVVGDIIKKWPAGARAN